MLSDKFRTIPIELVDHILKFIPPKKYCYVKSKTHSVGNRVADIRFGCCCDDGIVCRLCLVACCEKAHSVLCTNCSQHIVCSDCGSKCCFD